MPVDVLTQCREKGQFVARYYLSGVSMAVTIALAAPVVAEEALPADAAIPELTPVEVHADREQNDALINQGQVSKVGKTSVSIQDTPAAITVIDAEFIKEAGAKNIQDALMYSSGVYSGAFGFDTRGDWSKVRGLDASTFQDGLRSVYGYYNSARTEVYTLESIEVMKGPSSVLYGQSELGGIVNAVSKLPKDQQQGEIWAQVGSYDRVQLATDLTGPLVEDGSLLYRVVALDRKSGTQVDYVDDDGYVVSPSLTWKPMVGTELTLLYNQQENDGAVSAQFLPFKGTYAPAPLGQIPTETFVGEPGWDRYDQDRKDLTLFFDQDINNHWTFSGTLRKSESATETREHWAAIPFEPDDGGNTPRTIYMADRATDVKSGDVRVEGLFDLGGTRHTLAIGVDYVDAFWEEFNYFYGYAQGGTINLYNPQYGNLNASVLSPADRPDSQIEQQGIYLIDHMEIDDFIVSMALRQDRADTTAIAVDGSETSRSDKETSGRLGLMYRFDNGMSPYVSYSTSFTPNLGTGPVAGLLKPTTGEQKELGLKYLAPSNDLSVAFAWFDIEQEERVVNGVSAQIVAQTGATVEGWELEVKKRWQQVEMLVNLTELDAWDEGDDVRLSAVPDRMASVWTTYDVGWGVKTGFGARYTGDTVGALGGPDIPSVTLYDAMLSYSLPSWEFSVDARNLGDKVYISWCRYEGGDCGYGERRNMSASVRYKF